MRKIVVASDSFKGSLSSAQVAEAVEKAVLTSLPKAEVVKVNVADGGEGTVDAVTEALGGSMVYARVSDPLRRPVLAKYGVAGDLAIIEVAAACGLTLLKPEERNPRQTDTYGVGELILDAIHRGCNRFLIGLGGSATNDGGRGMLSVPGFLEAVAEKSFTVACDVDTPFVGPNGASRVFGPQKGASLDDVEILDLQLQEYAKEILERTGVDVSDMPGAGAAGGLGGAFASFMHAKLVPGVEMVLDAIRFTDFLLDADLVITGEGKSDFQTPKGKTPVGVLSRAKKAGIPVVLIAGKVETCEELESLGFHEIIQVTPAGMSLAEAMNPEIAAQNIRQAVSQVLSVFK